MSALNRTVLLAGGDPDLQRALADHLQICSFKVLQADCPVDAMQLLEEPDCPADLVFIDASMARGAGGISLARWVTENRSDMAVIVAMDDSAEREATDELDGLESIGKPLDYRHVTEKIRNAFARNR